MTSPPKPPHVVVLTAIYPPDPRVGGQRPGKLVRRLIERGFKVDVVTSSVPDSSPHTSLHGEHLHVITPNVTWRDRWVESKGKPQHRLEQVAFDPLSQNKAVGAKVWAAARTTVLAPFTVPDLERGIIGPMSAQARQLLQDRRAILYSTAPPHSTSVAARWALCGLGHPWVAEFRDPWTGAINEATQARPWLHDFLNRRLEGFVMRRADSFVAVSEGIGKWLGDRAPRKTVVVSRNGIDRIDARQSAPAGPSPLEVLYAGELYLGRDPRPFFSAIATLAEMELVTPGSLLCRFVGDVMYFRDMQTQRLASDHGVAGYVSLSPRVARSEVAALQDRAQLLLLLAQDQPLQVPNKLYEYLGSRKPILAFVDDAGETARLLRSVGGHFLVTETMAPDAVALTVRDALASASTGREVGDVEEMTALGTQPQLDRVADHLEQVWTSRYG